MLTAVISLKKINLFCKNFTCFVLPVKTFRYSFELTVKDEFKLSNNLSKRSINSIVPIASEGRQLTNVHIPAATWLLKTFLKFLKFPISWFVFHVFHVIVSSLRWFFFFLSWRCRNFWWRTLFFYFNFFIILSNCSFIGLPFFFNDFFFVTVVL